VIADTLTIKEAEEQEVARGNGYAFDQGISDYLDERTVNPDTH
jgi:hypothetical protein